MMIIYFAHSMMDYGTERELKSLVLIRRLFPYAVIINPATDTDKQRWVDQGMPYFDGILREQGVDLVVFQGIHPYWGVSGLGETVVTYGVSYEVDRAIALGVDILQIPLLPRGMRSLSKKETEAFYKDVFSPQEVDTNE